MAATDNLDSMDRLLKATRDQHADEMKALNDQLLAAQLELKLTQAALEKTQTDRATAERLTVKLLTQFGTVEAALSIAVQSFAHAKEFAMSAGALNEQTEGDDKQEPDTTLATLNAGSITVRDDGGPHYVQPPAGTPFAQPDAPHG